MTGKTLQKKSIAGLVISVLVTVVTLVLTVFVSLNYKVIEKEHWARLRIEHRVKTDQLAEGIAVSVWNFDEPQIDRIMRSVMNDQVVYGVVVSEKTKKHQLVRDAHWEAITGDSTIDGQGLLVEKSPIVFQGETIGEVQLFVTPKFINQEMREHLLSTIIMIVATDLILILVLYLLLWRMVLAPLKRVEQYAASVSLDDAAKIPVSNFSGELESLHLSIEKMVGELNLRFEQLQQSEQRFRVLIDQAPEAIAVYDADQDRFVDANKNAEQLFGCSKQELLQSSPYRFLTSAQPDALPVAVSVKRHIERALDGQALILERAIHNAQGKDLQCEIRLARLPFKDRKLIRASYIDITERKEAERLLIENQAHLQTLVQTIPDLIWLKNPDGIYLDCNTMFEKLFGAKKEVIIGKTDYDFVGRELADFFRDHDQKAIAVGGPSKNEEWVTFADDGHRALLDTIKTPMYDSRGTLIGVLGIGRDITERKRAEEENAKLEVQLQQAQKLEAIGQLAGGVAHDFNNMLGVIQGHAEMALELLDPGQPLYTNLDEILKAARRSADITRQLLAFAREQTIEPMALDLNQAVEEMLTMIRRLIGEDIDLVWMPGAGLWSVNVDPSQIDQILANLCINARAAIAGVGKITVMTENCILDEHYSTTHTDCIPGEYVRITVSDSGCGMDKMTLAHIFEPFFTTKGVGEGTGLGLATVFGAVKQNNGIINVYSEPGLGTSFAIHLPRYLGNTPGRSIASQMEPAAPGHETILLVEDEPTILGMTVRMLERLGYTVLAASSPEEAMRLFAEFAGAVHVLVTDVVMPGMNGRDLADRLLKDNPTMKCLFMSGYTANIITNQGVLSEGMNFIQKPFSTKELATKVRQVLG